MIALTTDLKRLGAVRAPAGFADRVLAGVGMADSYARFETVLGDVYVAWNRLCVSACEALRPSSRRCCARPGRFPGARCGRTAGSPGRSATPPPSARWARRL